MRHLVAERKPHVVSANGSPSPVYVREPAFQAFTILRVGFAALPIIAGADKFLHLLVNWNQYLSPAAYSLIGGHVGAFMDLVGIVEISAGVLVAIKPRWGSAIVGLWLLAIIVNLLMIPGYFDIALRDLGLAVGALAFYRLSAQFDT